MRVGLLGGTFNPVHRCHLTIAGQARDAMQLDRILFIPTGDPPHKDHCALAPAAHRVAMVRLAVEEHPSFAVSDIELRRTGKSYSIDTVRTCRNSTGPAYISFLSSVSMRLLISPPGKNRRSYSALVTLSSSPALPFRSACSRPCRSSLQRRRTH